MFQVGGQFWNDLKRIASSLVVSYLCHNFAKDPHFIKIHHVIFNKTGHFFQRSQVLGKQTWTNKQNGSLEGKQINKGMLFLPK
jgi:hypothetical protein